MSRIVMLTHQATHPRSSGLGPGRGPHAGGGAGELPAGRRQRGGARSAAPLLGRCVRTGTCGLIVTAVPCAPPRGATPGPAHDRKNRVQALVFCAPAMAATCQIGTMQP